MGINLDHIKVGDKLALRNKNVSWDKFAITHRILLVDRVTATQVSAGNVRFRKADGKVLGEDYVYTEEVTDGMIAMLAEQHSRRSRDQAARALLNDLEGKHLHQLHLTLEQTEALARAWTDIKAMKAA